MLNRVPTQGNTTAQARAELAAYDVKCLNETLGQRLAFARAIATGRTATETEPRSRAAAEIRALWIAVEAQLALSPPTDPHEEITR